MDNFLIISNRNRDENLEITNQIVKYIEDAGKKAILYEATFYEKIVGKMAEEEDLQNIIRQGGFGCAIVLGGDGTIIHAANNLMFLDIPILGINVGTLGFLAEVEEHNIYSSLDLLFQGKFQVNNRMMICGNLHYGYAHKGEKDDVLVGYALNDIVITRKGFSRIISLSVYVNDDLVDHFRGDGIIVSTPTGSTGYNLSAGGPVIVPKEELMVITPICSHSLNAKSIVVSGNDVIKVVVGKSRKTQETEAIATFDGDKVLELDIEDAIIIKKAKYSTKLIKLNEASIYEVLRTKLHHNDD